jgi:signal transduction histidine kinase
MSGLLRRLFAGGGLRARVGLSLVLLGGLVLVMQTVAVFMLVDQQEEEFINRILREEAQAMIGGSRHMPPTITRYAVHAPDELKDLPPEIRDLPLGLREVMISGKEFHVEVVAKDGVTYYLMYDASRHERRIDEFRNFLMVGILASIGLLIALGIWLSGVLVRQVIDLAARVKKLDPGAATSMLSPHFYDAEVLTLARAFDDYAHRVSELVGREKEFTANISHELRTPLTTIQTSCELLLEDRLSDKARARVQQIAAGAQRMTQLVEAMLLLAREVSMDNSAALNLRELVSDAAAPLLNALRAKGVAFDNRVAADAAVMASRVALLTLISNLLRNADVYTDHGHIAVHYHDGVLSVSDTGLGIASDDLPHVFDRAFRGSNARNHGTGIGLAIVRSIADRFNWDLDVRSRLGEGSTFTLDLSHAALPCSQIPHASATHPSSTAA